MSYWKQFRRRSVRKKVILLAICVPLLLTAAIGVTIAYSNVMTSNVENAFAPEKVTCSIQEDFAQGDTVKSNVKVANTSKIPVYLRAMWVVTWIDEEGKLLPSVPQAGVDYSINIPNEKWVDGGDGYYYYKAAVAAGDSTENLIDNITVLKNIGNYQLQVEIISEAIQAEPVEAVQTAWPNAGIS